MITIYKQKYRGALVVIALYIVWMSVLCALVF